MNLEFIVEKMKEEIVPRDHFRCWMTCPGGSMDSQPCPAGMMA